MRDPGFSMVSAVGSPSITNLICAKKLYGQSLDHCLSTRVPQERKNSPTDIFWVPQKISLFALTVVAIFVTKHVVCDNHHQVFCSHLILVHRTK
jgi:hypothetical protein